MDTKYNGWTNYETWNYALWLDNDQGSSEYWNEQAQSAYDNADSDRDFTKPQRATLDLADTLKAECEERAEEWMPDQCGPFADLLNAALSEINWHEIAEHYIENVETETA
jgi:hypothetical protein